MDDGGLTHNFLFSTHFASPYPNSISRGNGITFFIHACSPCLLDGKYFFARLVSKDTYFFLRQGLPRHKKLVSIQNAGGTFMSEIQATYKKFGLYYKPVAALCIHLYSLLYCRCGFRHTKVFLCGIWTRNNKISTNPSGQLCQII